MSIPSKQKRTHRGKWAPTSYECIAVLIAPSAGPMTGADIGGTVIADTVGAIALKKSSLYRLTRELTESSYLAHANGAYTLTDKDWRALRNELNRIEQQRIILKQRLHV